MKRTLLLLSLILAAALAGCSGGGSGESNTAVIDLSHDGTLGNGFGNVEDEIKRWQTFTATGYPVLTAVEVKLRKIGTGTFRPIRVELYETDAAGKPDGDALAYSQIPTSWVTDEFTAVKTGFDYSGLVKGRRYAIVLSGLQVNTAHYEWLDQVKVDPDEYFGKYWYDPAVEGYVWKDESGLGDGWLKLYVASARPQVSRVYLYAVNETQSGSLRGPGGRSWIDALAAERPVSLTGLRCHAFLSIDAADCIANLPDTFGFPRDVPIISGLDMTTVIADNWADLLDGSIKATLADAIGLEDNWWSGSKADGTLSNNCDGWDDEEADGQVGSNTATDSHWIDNGSDWGMSFYRLLGFAY